MLAKDLVRAWNVVQANPPKGWAQVRGPIGAATFSAVRLQWDTSRPWKWTTDCVVQLSLLEASQRFIEWLIEQTWNRLVCFRSVEELRDQGCRIDGAVDLMVPRQVIESHAADQFTPLQKGALRAVVCDAVCTKERLLAAGYKVRPLCELCRMQHEQLFHWL